MVWSKAEIIRALRKLSKAGTDLSYNALAKRKQSLVSAAAYHFGSYRKAIEEAGLVYGDLTRRPRWTKSGIIALIKAARRGGENLNWSSVTRRRDELGRAAFAALQPRLFGSWDQALQAAGLDADDINRYRKWDKERVIVELRGRHRAQKALNSGAIQQEDPGLHAAAVRHFTTYDGALSAARLDPLKVRKRRAWDKPTVLRAIKQARRKGIRLSDSSIRREMPTLYSAAVRLFGSFKAARSAAGIVWKRGG